MSATDDRGQPRKCYKYLGVYFYTSDFSDRAIEFVQAEVNSFFTHLTPLQRPVPRVIEFVQAEVNSFFTHLAPLQLPLP